MTEEEHYQGWAGTGPNAQELWDVAGRESTSYAEMDEFLEPFFEHVRDAGFRLTPEQLEDAAGKAVAVLRERLAQRQASA